MQNFDPVLETRVIKTVLADQTPDFIKNLTPDWFGLPQAKEIWERLQSLRRNGKQIPSSQTFAGDPVLSEKAQMLLRGDLDPLPKQDTESALTQLDIFRQTRAISRSMMGISDLMKSEQVDLNEIKQNLQMLTMSLDNHRAEDEILMLGGDKVDETLGFYEDLMAQDVNKKILRTGFKAIDDQQGGFMRGKVYAIGANSGGGKSTLADQIAQYIVGSHQSSAGYLSYEMGKEENLMRSVARLTSIPHDRFQLRKLSDRERIQSTKQLARFMQQASERGFSYNYLCPTRDLSVPQALAEVEHLNHGIEVVDYVNLAAPIDPKQDLWWNIGEAFRWVKRYAERTQKVILMLVQTDEETGNIKYAKSIKHHSDGVWIWKYDDKAKETKVVEIEQTKLRSFEPKKFNLRTEFEYCRFSESSMPMEPVQLPRSVEPMRM